MLRNVDINLEINIWIYLLIIYDEEISRKLMNSLVFIFCAKLIIKFCQYKNNDKSMFSHEEYLNNS
jgi:hypothetical protein